MTLFRHHPYSRPTPGNIRAHERKPGTVPRHGFTELLRGYYTAMSSRITFFGMWNGNSENGSRKKHSECIFYEPRTGACSPITPVPRYPETVLRYCRKILRISFATIWAFKIDFEKSTSGMGYFFPTAPHLLYPPSVLFRPNRICRSVESDKWI